MGKHRKPLTEEHKRKISEGNRGKLVTEETCKKISEAHKGKILSNETKEKIRKANLGTHRSQEVKNKISMALKGRFFSEETRKKLRENNSHYAKGTHHSIEWRRKVADSMRGNKSHLWKGGITPAHTSIRNSLEMQLWKEACLKRDDFNCQRCKQHGGKLRIHHIHNFADFPELRLAIDNGATLCYKCHTEYHAKYGKKNNTAERFRDFVEVLNSI